MESTAPSSATGDATRATAILKVLFAVVVWGASFIATKMAVAEAAPVTVVWLRFAMGVVILGGVVAARRQLALPSGSDLVYFAFLGFIGIAFHQWLQSNGLVTAQASTTAWIVTTIPVFMAVLGWILLRERVRPVTAAGIVVAAAGVLVVVSGGDLTAIARGSFGTPGDLLVLASSLNWAIFSVVSRKGLQRHPSAAMTFWVMLWGWLQTGLLFFAGPGPGPGDIASLTPRGWGAVLFLGLVCSGVAYVFWYDALRDLPASQVGAFLYVEPLVAVAVAAVLLGEPVTLATLAGGAAILLGVWMASLRPAARDASPGPGTSSA